MSNASHNVRQQAAKTISSILLDTGTLASLPASTGDEAQLTSLPFLKELCFGVCRHHEQLNTLASSLLKKPMRKKDTDVFSTILIGLYQLYFLRTPAHAAINETVGSIKAPWARGLVNGVLRESLRRYPDFPYNFSEEDSFRFSHPTWLINIIRQDWPEQLEQILEANNQRAPMTLRVNLQKTDRAAYLEALKKAEITATPGELADTSIILDKPMPVSTLPGFSEGLVSVQDEASQLVPNLLALSPELHVLDACSAPGGKTCGMLEQEPSLLVTSLDNDAHRLSRVKDNLERLALKANIVCEDACSAEKWHDNSLFDRILLDAPCSATGVIRRHPDIKVLRTPQQVKILKEKQASLLNALWPLLKPGGILLYSTCSVLRGENSDQIQTFCEHHPDAKHREISLEIGQRCDFGHQLLPGQANQDGFYYARLEKC